MRAIIDPADNIQYKSFYVKALYDTLGKDHVSFASRPFRGLSKQSRTACCMLFVTVDTKQGRTSTTKYCISLNDPYKIHPELYEWCDVYGSVNANYTHYPKEQYPKLISLCPSFAVRCFGRYEALFMALSNLTKAPACILGKERYNKQTQSYEHSCYRNLQHHIGQYLKGYTTRCRYGTYRNDDEALPDQLFFLSTLWYSDQWNKNDEGVNLSRSHFIRAVKRFPNLSFEGGLVGDSSSSNAKFRDVLSSQRTTLEEWITKSKQSTFVFNTPAFWNCHGWKLGEYLAMGKCIISTPLSNDLPAPLVHGKQLHYVDNNEDSMAKAIAYIVDHPDYRRHLEQGATAYWERYGSPTATLRLLGIGSRQTPNITVQHENLHSVARL